MPRAASVAVENQFIRGLVTEATGLNFPENACTETFNCVFDEKGIVRRRLGFDFESGTVLENAPRSDSNINTYLWESVAGQRDVSFVVVQIGNLLWFYGVTATGALSAQKHAHEIDLTDFQIAGSPDVNDIDCQFASGSGVLVVTHPYCQSFYVSYAVTGATLSETVIDIEIRDFEGVDDSLVVDARPATLSDSHEYNLYNQGWYAVATAQDGNEYQVVVRWDSVRTDFPSNADQWFLFKNASDQADFLELGDSFALGNSRAPMGHFILDAFDTDRSGAHANIGTVTETTSSYFRPKTCAFFSSRVFYSGVDYPNYNNKIYFSQILDDLAKIGLCYQSNDPTSEELFDLLPTDGGVIVIPEIGNIIKMVALETALLIFASNGIWSVSGSQGVGFAANDYSVSKISSVPTLTENSFAIVNGFPVWWNNDGIYQLAPEKVSQTLAVQSMTDQTIKQFFDNIPDAAKSYAKGSYNTLTRVIQWVYRQENSLTTDDRYNYDSTLSFNTITSAFFPWTISPADETVNGILAIKGIGPDNEPSNCVTFYLTSIDNSVDWDFTFSQERSSVYTDWGEDYDSYFITGYKIRGDAQRKFQENYITVHMNREEDSSCFLQGRWNYSVSADSGKWTNKQQVYLDNENFSVVRRRVKIRGHGVSFQLKFESETGKPFSLIGWTAFETGNQSL